MKSYSNIREIIAFLRELADNNDRRCFADNKERYDALRQPWEKDMERLIAEVGEYDDNTRSLDVKQSVYRIYRDVRFSADKSPYKRYFSGVIGRGGRHTHISCNYVHFEPDNIMMGGGVWWPEKPVLDRLRALIDAERDEWLTIVNNPEFASRYHWECDTLKKMPADYRHIAPDDPVAPYIRMKEYIAMMRPPMDYFDCDDWVERVAGDLRHLMPMHNFLNYVFDL